jgi:hypothetical protein
MFFLEFDVRPKYEKLNIPPFNSILPFMRVNRYAK